MIPFNDLRRRYELIKPDVDRALADVIESARFIKGPQVGAFEAAFASFCGAAHCVGTANGTAALHLSLIGCGVGPGDEVVTSPMSFIATAEAIGHAGARVIFADIDETTYTLSPSQAASALTPRTKAIVPVHLYGQPADLAPLTELAAGVGARVVGDAAQAHGALYRGRPVGALGDAACFSFYPGKNLGAFGDAGAVTCQDPGLAERVRLLADHGRKEKYVHLIEGYNYRLDTLQAAVLLAQLGHLEAWNARRRQIAALYDAGLRGLPVVTPRVGEGRTHVYHLYVIQTDERERLRAHLQRNGVASMVHYPLPLHLQPAYAHLGVRAGSFPVAEALARRALSLPVYPEMSIADAERVVEAVGSYFGRAA